MCSSDLGLPGFSAYEWNGIWAPAATPPDIVKRMEAELREALKSPVVRQRLADLGALPAGGGAKEFADFVNAETAKWAGVIKTSNIKLD